MKLSRWFVLLLVLMFLLSACSSTQTPTKGTEPTAPAPAPAPATEPVKGGQIVFAYSAEPSSLSPQRNGDGQAHLIYYGLYDCLVELDDNMKPVPGLAETWSISPDGLNYTFTIRKGVKFHNGEELTPETVKWNAEQWANPPKSAINGNTNIASAKVDGDNVIITLKAMDNQFITDIAGRGYSILPPKYMASVGDDFNFKPVGTGPFKFSSWVTDSQVELVRNDDYWRKDKNGNAEVYLDKVIFRKIAQAQVRTSALQLGEVDVNFEVAAEHTPQVKSNKDLHLSIQPIQGHVVLRLRTTQPPLDKKEVRQAISWAIDRDAINDAIYFGTAVPAYGFFAPVSPAYDSNFKPYYPRNLQKAKDLLAKAGYPNGFKITSVVATPAFQPMAELIQAQLKEVGIDFQPVTMERGIYLDMITKRQHESYLSSVTGRGDPSGYMSHVLCGAVYNGSDWCNKDVDQMQQDAVSKFIDPMDPKRIDLYKKINQIIMDDMPVVPVAFPVSISAWKTDIHNITISPVGRMRWTTAWREKK